MLDEKKAMLELRNIIYLIDQFEMLFDTCFDNAKTKK